MGVEVVGQFNPVSATINQQKALEKSVKAQRRQGAAQLRMQNIEMQRQRIAQVREARAKRAQILAASESAGVAGGSGEAGGIGSIQSQLGANLSFLDTAQASQQYQFKQGVKSADAQADAAMWGAIGSLSGTVFAAAGGPSTAFGGNTSPTKSLKATGS